MINEVVEFAEFQSKDRSSIRADTQVAGTPSPREDDLFTFELGRIASRLSSDSPGSMNDEQIQVLEELWSFIQETLALFEYQNQLRQEHSREIEQLHASISRLALRNKGEMKN